MMKKIQVEYVAMLREAAGTASEEWQTEAKDALGLYGQICARHSIAYPSRALRVAINDTLTAWSAEIQDGDRVLFLPPSSGG